MSPIGVVALLVPAMLTPSLRTRRR